MIKKLFLLKIANKYIIVNINFEIIYYTKFCDI